MFIKGYLPEKIIYVYSTSTNVGVRFDDIEPLPSAGETVTPAFCVDAEKPLETARNWAKHNGTPQELHLDNKPFSGLRICSLESRGEGGRAYKVVTKEGFYFDLREDVLLEAMVVCGVSAGGTLGGEYMWGKLGSQMRLVRVNSPLYDALLISGRRRNLKPLILKDLKPGHVYQDKEGNHVVWIGKVTSSNEEFAKIIKKKGSYAYYFRTFKWMSEEDRAMTTLEWLKDQDSDYPQVNVSANIKVFDEIEDVGLSCEQFCESVRKNANKWFKNVKNQETIRFSGFNRLEYFFTTIIPFKKD